MDKKVYVWLFKNVNRYRFEGQEANQVKNAMSRMLITEDSINSDEMVMKMQGVYNDFCNLFYNNIFGYQNGLANKPITANELDCYFVKVSDGMVPIGYYREFSPVEAVTMVQRLLEYSKNEINAEKNQIIVKWQKDIETVGEQYEKIANSGNLTPIRAILGFAFSGILLVLSLISLINLKLLSVIFSLGNQNVINDALSNIPIISYGGTTSWVMYLVFVILAIVLGGLGILLAVKELKLLSAKRTTKEVLNKTVLLVTDLERGINDSVESCKDGLFAAARRGENVTVQQEANAGAIKKINSQIQIALDYSAKNERQRTGIGYVMLAFMLVITIAFGLSYVQGIADAIGSISSKKTVVIPEIPEIPDEPEIPEIPDEPEEPEPIEIPKNSYYEVYKSDADWFTARSEALSRGGYLVSINNEEEFIKVCDAADNAGIKVFWVGMRRSYNNLWEDSYWEDGTGFSYVKWLENEPTLRSETGEEETCLMVFKVNGQWCFNDAVSDVSQFYSGRMGYIVEIEE